MQGALEKMMNKKRRMILIVAILLGLGLFAFAYPIGAILGVQAGY